MKHRAPRSEVVIDGSEPGAARRTAEELDRMKTERRRIRAWHQERPSFEARAQATLDAFQSGEMEEWDACALFDPELSQGELYLLLKAASSNLSIREVMRDRAMRPRISRRTDVTDDKVEAAYERFLSAHGRSRGAITSLAAEFSTTRDTIRNKLKKRIGG